MTTTTTENEARTIPGWMSEDTQAIYRQAVRNALDGDVFVEVGVAFGQSIAYLANLAIVANKDLSIYGVDPWIMPPDDEVAVALTKQHGGYFEACVHELKSKTPGAFNYIRELMVCMSTEAARHFVQERIRPNFVFLDGDKRRLAVLKDLSNFWPMIQRGGALAGTGWEIDTVRDAVEAFAKDEALLVTVEGTGWRFQK